MGGGIRSEVLFGLLVLASLSFGGTMSVRDSAAGSPVSNIQQVRGPILIEGDANFTAANGVTSGTGLPGDPYIIAGWNISAAVSNAISARNGEDVKTPQESAGEQSRRVSRWDGSMSHASKSTGRSS